MHTRKGGLAVAALRWSSGALVYPRVGGVWLSVARGARLDAGRIVLMVDSVEVAGPVVTPAQASALVSQLAADPALKVVLLMAYEGAGCSVPRCLRSVAGSLPSSTPYVVSWLSTGSSWSSSTAGGRARCPEPRRPGRGVATVLGGYSASGAAGRDRLPSPVLPAGMKLIGTEGAGKVQTPLRGAAAERLAVGDRVYFRHAKAGELAKRFSTLLLISSDRVVDEVPAYRGEGKTFL